MRRLQAAFSNCFSHAPERHGGEDKLGALLPAAVGKVAEGVPAVPVDQQPTAAQVGTISSFHVHLSPLEEVQVLDCLAASGHIVAWEARPPPSFFNRPPKIPIALGNVGPAQPILPIPSSVPPDCEEGVPWVLKDIYSSVETICSGDISFLQGGALPPCSDPSVQAVAGNPSAEHGVSSSMCPTRLIVLSHPSSANVCATGKYQANAEAPFIVHNKVYQKAFHSLAKDCSRLGTDVKNMLQGLASGECSSCRHLVVHKPGPASHKALLPFTLEVRSCYILLHRCVGGDAVMARGQQPPSEPVRVPCLLVKCPSRPLQEHLTAAELDQIPAMLTVFDSKGHTIKQNCRSQEYIDWLQHAAAVTRIDSTAGGSQYAGGMTTEGPHDNGAARPVALDLIFQWDPEALQDLKCCIAQGQEYEDTILVPYPTASQGFSHTHSSRIQSLFGPAAASQQTSTHGAAARKHSGAAGQAMSTPGCGSYTTVKTGMVEGGDSNGAEVHSMGQWGVCDLAEPSSAMDLNPSCTDLATELRLGAPPGSAPPAPLVPVAARGAPPTPSGDPASPGVSPVPEVSGASVHARFRPLQLNSRRSLSLDFPAGAMQQKSETAKGTPVPASPPSVRNRVNALLHTSFQASLSEASSGSSMRLAGLGNASTAPSSHPPAPTSIDERRCSQQPQPEAPQKDCKAGSSLQGEGIGHDSGGGASMIHPGVKPDAIPSLLGTAGLSQHHRWHRVHAKCYHDMASRMDLMILTQMDVTDQVEMQLRLQAVLEHEHKVLEGMFPRHVIEHIAAVGCGAMGAGVRPGPGATTHLCHPQYQQQWQQGSSQPTPRQQQQQQQEDAVQLQPARPPPPGLKQQLVQQAQLGACPAAEGDPPLRLPADAFGSRPPPPWRVSEGKQPAAAGQAAVDGRAIVQELPRSSRLMDDMEHLMPLGRSHDHGQRLPASLPQQRPSNLVMLLPAAATASKDFFSAPTPGMLGAVQDSHPPGLHSYHLQRSLNSAPNAGLGSFMPHMKHPRLTQPLPTITSRSSTAGVRSMYEISLSESLAELTSRGGPMILLEGAARAMHEESEAPASTVGHVEPPAHSNVARPTETGPGGMTELHTSDAAYGLNALSTSHPLVTIMFADIHGFTAMCNMVPPHTVMGFLNHLYHHLDQMLDQYGVYKVETIGDCYMVAGGLLQRDTDGYMAVVQEPHPEKQARQVMDFAKAALAVAADMRMPHDGGPVQLRVGLHTGPVISGIVGCKMPRFCLFGDTVNTASRCESTGVPGHIHVSATTRQLLGEGPEAWQQQQVQAKGKGAMTTFLWPKQQE